MEKYYCISVEGIDKSGKGQILKYVDILGKHKYVLMDRGLISNITYARMYNRDYQYDKEQFKNWLFVYLTCDYDDWKVRCKLTNEPEIDYSLHLNEFNRTFNMFLNDSYHCLTFNTSHETPYEIAKSIINHIENLKI